MYIEKTEGSYKKQADHVKNDNYYLSGLFVSFVFAFDEYLVIKYFFHGYVMNVSVDDHD